MKIKVLVRGAWLTTDKGRMFRLPDEEYYETANADEVAAIEKSCSARIVIEKRPAPKRKERKR